MLLFLCTAALTARPLAGLRNIDVHFVAVVCTIFSTIGVVIAWLLLKANGCRFIGVLIVGELYALTVFLFVVDGVAAAGFA